jgi:hypothetical protein
LGNKSVNGSLWFRRWWTTRIWWTTRPNVRAAWPNDRPTRTSDRTYARSTRLYGANARALLRNVLSGAWFFWPFWADSHVPAIQASWRVPGQTADATAVHPISSQNQGNKKWQNAQMQMVFK